MALCSSSGEVEDSALEGWNVIGSGGFGQIYKARHRLWGCDVAIKLLHYDDGTSSSLLRELDMMRQGSNPYVIHVHGMFKGRPPFLSSSVQLGLVMEFMERGSLASLQNTLLSPLPWPLSVRLTHQVALGINFLHTCSPTVLHLDLKPSNVLLDPSLNAKLTDFGLAKFYHSCTRASRKSSEDEGGTISYMPPEAFDVSYRPTPASDIYSFGVLLWSVVTGKQPYADALPSIVRFRIPLGDRPSLNEIRCQAAGWPGLTRLMDLMQECWEAKSSQRPTALECTRQTEGLFEMHKHVIADAVYHVLKKLESVPARAEPVNICNDVPTGNPPVQEMAGRWTPNERQTVRDSPPRRLNNVCQVDQAHSSGDYEIKPSSVHPIHSSSPSVAVLACFTPWANTPLCTPTPPRRKNFH
ncbi:receptor-interacting serine/threonine-protein kinase 3-like [Melanotaenia boesemani]|uniref:receptor-interacting serine/threonine-protein kinase 3-like n=1 Tax=Melanotaenia boesemani TaxID=1250792 RepID=UPI001C043EB7|nr:receptor-interacting serine/threonine-protein kinase 3-like [Melanotaenia boesemani]XP_041840971.1 receptor-interacting serine/threonine-protein kinase 3-like [Melanotaenia boesemani]